MDTSKNSVFQSFAAGAASGTVSTVLLQPLDMVKTRLQTSPSIPLRTHFRTIYRREGLLAFWKGLAPSLVRTVPGVGLYFSCLNYLQFLVCGSQTPSSFQFMLLGGMSRTIAGTLLMPATVIKIRFESGLYRYTGILHALGQLGRIEGLRGLTSGIIPTLLRDVPFSSVYLLFYSKFKSLYAEASRKSSVPSSAAQLGQVPDVINFTCGLFAGLLACCVTQPFDVVKTRMQVRMGSRRSLKYAREVYSSRGFTGFFTGLTPRLLRRTLMASLSWTLYENVMRRQKRVER